LACIWKLRFQILKKENNLALFYVSNGYIFNVQRIFDFDTMTKQNDKARIIGSEKWKKLH
jgi:hypothetical protein